jgi:hypothetical protein
MNDGRYRRFDNRMRRAGFGRPVVDEDVTEPSTACRPVVHVDRRRRSCDVQNGYVRSLAATDNSRSRIPTTAAFKTQFQKRPEEFDEILGRESTPDQPQPIHLANRRIFDTESSRHPFFTNGLNP